MRIQADHTVVFNAGKLGHVKMSEIENIFEIANSIQRAYQFRTYAQPLRVNLGAYKLPNGTYDLDKAATCVHRRAHLPRPFIFLTALPYGDEDTQDDPDYTYFIGQADEHDNGLSIISTFNWEQKLKREPLQQYILLMLASQAFWHAVDLSYHNETVGCLFDYDFEISEIDRVLDLNNPLCDECEQRVQRAIREGRACPEQVGSAVRLFNRAVGKKSCFIAMPFRDDLRVVHRRIAQALREDGWIVRRADDIQRPRRITDAIALAVLSSNLVVADLTGANPNVFYELGVAHAHGCDTVMVTQDRRIPFDVAAERAVFYETSKAGLGHLQSEVKRLAGSHCNS